MNFTNIFLKIVSLLLLTNYLFAIDCKSGWINPETIEKMYDEYDLSSCPLFTGGFINFGYWDGKFDNCDISLSERLESEKNMYRAVLKKLAVSSQDRILEVGCGLGLGSALLLNEFSPKEVEAIDFSKAQISRAKNMNQDLTSTNKLQFLIGEAEKIPFQNESFEKVFSIEAAQHFSSVKDFIKESYRVLKPKGKLAIATFFATTDESSKKMFSMIKTVEDKIDNLIPISDICDSLKKSGFENIKIESIGTKVWFGFDKWIAQTELFDTWDRNWYKAYQQNLVDYYIVTAEKPEKFLQVVSKSLR